MVSKKRKNRSCRGVTMIGAMVAVVVLLIALIGTSTFRYTAALDGKKADAQTTASRIALLLCESWRGLNGDTTLDPMLLAAGDLQITPSLWDSHVTPAGFTLLGNYEIVMDTGDPDGLKYYTTLSWNDVQPGLRALNINVSWAQRTETAKRAANVDKSYALTVYAQTY